MRFACLLAISIAPIWASRSHAEDLGIRVPEGFEVSLYADDELAHDIFSMTIDARGRVVVAGLGYVKTLHDDNGDGRADRATVFSDVPKSGAHGMCFDGNDLICTGDNGVWRLPDANGDGRADGAGTRWTELKHPEHGANGIVQGPDGCFYLICGNDAGIAASHAVLATSPVRQPNCGSIVRFSPEGKVLDVFAHGFRNPYDLDFDPQGRIFTVDADGERDHHLPWYAPTRLFDVAQGMHHGWLLKGWSRSWNRPPSFADNIERMVEIGRGSPTGIVSYRHRQFPDRYRGGVLAACWTFGRVYFFPLTNEGASATSKLEVFMQTTGDVGFAPCDLAIGPEGDLFVAIGGRRTRGSVFRVRYRDGAKLAPPSDPLEQVLRADQPLASWSRARWAPLARQLGRAVFVDTVGDANRDTADRTRALEVLVELFGGITPEEGAAWAKTENAEVRARLAWALGRGQQSGATSAVLAQLTADDDPAVQKFAWEALATSAECDGNASPDWARGLSSDLRRVRSAAIAAARTTQQANYRGFLARVRLRSDAYALRMAQIWTGLPEMSEAAPQDIALNQSQIDTCLEIAGNPRLDAATRLEAVRLLQIAVGDILAASEPFGGYESRLRDLAERPQAAMLATQLAKHFPTNDAELNRELARLLGMLKREVPGLPAVLAGQWSDTTSVEDDIHYLAVSAMAPGPRDSATTAATARALLKLHHKLDAAGHFASRNWPAFVYSVYEKLLSHDPQLFDTVAASPLLNRVEHALFFESGPASDSKHAAITKLWRATVDQGQEPTPELIAIVAALPQGQGLPLVRAQWEYVGLRDPIVLALAKQPRPEDRAKFLEGLSSTQPEVVRASAKGLEGLGMANTPAEMAAVLRALKQACALEKQLEPRTTLMRLLEFWTEDGADVDWDPDPTKLWIGWYKTFADYFPAEAARLNATSGTDTATWKQRFEAIDWSSGDAARGRIVFEQRACHRCHQQSGHLGPELTGPVARMSRDDLLLAIVDPNLEVSPTYWTTAVVTPAGQVYHGLVVYESPEGILLQTGPDTTVRITGVDETTLRKSPRSLMPTGLLDPLGDRELSDLYAYLKSLGQRPAAVSTR